MHFSGLTDEMKMHIRIQTEKNSKSVQVNNVCDSDTLTMQLTTCLYQI